MTCMSNLDTQTNSHFLLELCTQLRQLFARPLVGALLGLLMMSVLMEFAVFGYISTFLICMQLYPLAKMILARQPLKNIWLMLYDNALYWVKMGFLLFAAAGIIEVFKIGLPTLFIAEVMPIALFLPLIICCAHKLLPWLSNGIELNQSTNNKNISYYLEKNSPIDYKRLLTELESVIPKKLKGSVKLYISPNPIGNAYAVSALLPLTKHKHSIIINCGFLNLIARSYPNHPDKVYSLCKGVVAHEVGHLIHQHSNLLSFFIPFKMLFPLYKSIINFCENLFSRQCEYEADRYAAKQGLGEELIEALSILSCYDDFEPHKTTGVLNQWVLPMYLAADAAYNTISEYQNAHPTLANRADAIRNHRSPALRVF